MRQTRRLPGIPGLLFFLMASMGLNAGFAAEPATLSAFVAAAKERGQGADGRGAFEASILEYQLPLTLGCVDATFPAYAGKAADASVPEAARAYLFKVMARRAARLARKTRGCCSPAWPRP